MKSMEWFTPFILSLLCLFTACKTADLTRKDWATSHFKDTEVVKSTLKQELVVSKENFSPIIMEKIRTTHDVELKAALEARSDQCRFTEDLLNRLFDRLIDGAGLRSAAEQDPKVVIALKCMDFEKKSPEIRAGVIWVFPEILLALETEDQVAALLARPLIQYLRAHEESLADVYSIKLPFRNEAASRAIWEQSKEADRLSVLLLKAGGFDPFAAVEVPRLVEAFLIRHTDWKEDQIDPRFGTLSDRSMRSKVEIEHRRLERKPQTPGDMAELKLEINSRKMKAP